MTNKLELSMIAVTFFSLCVHVCERERERISMLLRTGDILVM
jgi:hypothetical protein